MRKSGISPVSSATSFRALARSASSGGALIGYPSNPKFNHAAMCPRFCPVVHVPVRRSVPAMSALATRRASAIMSSSVENRSARRSRAGAPVVGVDGVSELMPDGTALSPGA